MRISLLDLEILLNTTKESLGFINWHGYSNEMRKQAIERVLQTMAGEPVKVQEARDGR